MIMKTRTQGERTILPTTTATRTTPTEELKLMAFREGCDRPRFALFSARYHIDCAERIGVADGEATNKIQASGAGGWKVWSAKMCGDLRARLVFGLDITYRFIVHVPVQHKPLTTLPAQAMLDEGLEAPVRVSQRFAEFRKAMSEQIRSRERKSAWKCNAVVQRRSRRTSSQRVPSPLALPPARHCPRSEHICRKSPNHWKES